MTLAVVALIAVGAAALGFALTAILALALLTTGVLGLSAIPSRGHGLSVGRLERLGMRALRP